MSVVLDASAVIALLNDESGAEIVHDALEGALISAVNVLEVLTRLIDAGMPPEEAEGALAELALEVAPFDLPLAHRAAALRLPTRSEGLSLGDRACLALAAREQMAALTADRAWSRIDAGCEVRLIR